MKRSTFLLVTMGIFALGISAHADTTVFSDNFNTENGGVGFLNYGTPNQDGTGGAGTVNTNFAQWTVTGGSVDLIPIPVNNGKDGYPGPYQLLPTSYGEYVDLDGTTGQNGTLTSEALSLGIGSYKLFFDMAGSQRGQDGSALVSVQTGITNKTITLPSNQAMQTYEIDFTLTSAQTVHLSFQDTTSPGDDDIGPLLDNIVLDEVGGSSQSTAPDGGSTLMLLGAGIIGLGLLRRKLGR